MKTRYRLQWQVNSSLFILLFFVNITSAWAQLRFSELSGDSGNNDGTNDGIVELTNSGAADFDASCYVISNGEWVVVLPPNTILASGEVFLIACSEGIGTGSNPNPIIGSGLTCATCDFPNLPIDFDVCNPANAAYVDWAATGFTIDNQSDTDGDQLVLFEPDGTILQAVKWGGGATGLNDNTTLQISAYSIGTAGSNGNGSSSAQFPFALTSGTCATAVTYTMPIITDVIYEDLTSVLNAGGKAVNNAVLQGCNSSFIFNGTNWSKTDHPNPGLINSTPFEDFTAPINLVQCLNNLSDINLTLDILNYQAVEESVTTPGGQIGSLVSINGGAANAWTVSLNIPANGTTRLAYTLNTAALTALGAGTHTITLVWKDRTRSAIASTSQGSNSLNAVLNNSTPSDCYTVRKVTITLLEALTSAAFTCANGLIKVTATPANAGGLTYNLINAVDVTLNQTNTTGVFSVSAGTAGDYSVQVAQSLGCVTTVIATGTICVAAPACPNPNGETINSGNVPINICPNDNFTLAVDGTTSTNLPDGGTINWYYSSTSTFNPYNSEGSLLGQSAITATGASTPAKTCGGANALAAGDIAIIDVQTSGDDRFSFVPLMPLAAGTVIVFTDNGWLSAGGFRSGEGTITFTVGASDLPAGTIVTVTNPTVSANLIVTTGTVARSGSFSLATAGDQLIAYCPGTPIVPLAAVHTRRATFESDAMNASTSALPTGLTIGQSAVAIGGAGATILNGIFNCTGGNVTGTPAVIASNVYNAANWTTSAALQTLPSCTYSVSGGTVTSVTSLITSLADCGQTIYIKGIVNPLPSGCDETNATTATFTVNLNPCPIAILSGSGTFCAPTNGTAIIQITNGGSNNNITGNITDSTNDFPFNGTTAADGTATITVTGINISSDYTIEVINIANTCQINFSGTASVIVNVQPTVVLDNSATTSVCNGNIVSIPITTSGTLPMTITLNYNPSLTGVPTTIEVFSNTINIPIPDDANLTGSIVDYTITITAVTDANNCTGTFSGSRTLRIYPKPTLPTPAADQTLCIAQAASNVNLTFSATPQNLDGIEWYDAAVGGTSQDAGNTLNVSNYFSAGPYPQIVTFYAQVISSNGIGCGSTERVPVNIILFVNPTADVMTTAPVCTTPTQGSVNIDLTAAVNGNINDLEYAIVMGATFSGSPTLSDITTDPLIITSGFGSTADADGETYTVRIRYKNAPTCFVDKTYTLTSPVCNCTAPPSVIITETNVNICGTNFATFNYTVQNGPTTAFSSDGTGTLSLSALPNGTSTFTYIPSVAEAVSGAIVTITATIADPDGIGICVAATDVATLTVLTPANAGTPTPPITVCDNSTTAIDLFGLLTGEQAGGIWTRTTGTGGIFDANAGTFTPAAGAATTSTFTYTVTGTTPCPDDTEIVTVTINTAPDLAAIVTQNNACPTATFDLASLNITDNNNTTGTLSYYNNQADATNEVNGTSSNITISDTYYIRKETITGCFDIVSVEVNIITCIPCPNPNGETINGGAGPIAICVGTDFTLAVDGAASTNLPNGSTIDWYYSNISTFDPYNSEGTFLGQSNIIGGGTMPIYPLQNFNILAAAGSNVTWANNTTITDWYSNRATYNAGTGSNTAGSLYSFGTTAADRALGSLASGGTGTIFYGVQITNTTGATITQLDVQYTGEQWRNSGNTTPQKLDFAYQLNAANITTGTWTDFNALDFTGPIATASAAALDGNLPTNKVALNATITGLNILNGQSIWLRWQDMDDSGSDHGLAVDDLTVTTNFGIGTTVSSLVTSLPAITCGSTQYVKGIVNPLAANYCEIEGTTATFIINVNPCPTATLDANATPNCATSGSATILIINGGNGSAVSGNITNGTTDFAFFGTTLADGTATIVINNINVSGTYIIETITIGIGLCSPIFSGSAVFNLGLNVGQDGSTDVCNNQIDLVNLHDIITDEADGGTWTVQNGAPNPGTNFNAANGILNVNGLIADTYQFIYTVAGTINCPNDEVVATVIVHDAIQVNAGSNLTTCSSKPLNLTTIGASISGGTTTGIWSTSGDGTFTGGTTFGSATAYVSGANDRKNGTVVLTLTSADPTGPCTIVSDTVVITIQNVDCGGFPWSGGN